MPSQPQPFVKQYATVADRRRAHANYVWLSTLDSPLRLPKLLGATDITLAFEQVPGAHARPRDLLAVAAHLGEVHAAAHNHQLQHVRLDAGASTDRADDLHSPPGFLTPKRINAIRHALEAGVAPEPLLHADQAEAWLRGASDGPAAFYKDANLRNLLIDPSTTTHGNRPAPPFTVDFDDLTLAPFGYDLAKHIVSLAMTYGPLPDDAVTQSVKQYNLACTTGCGRLAGVSVTEVLAWTEIHHILTSRYVGRHGYRYSWHQVRPRLVHNDQFREIQ